MKPIQNPKTKTVLALLATAAIFLCAPALRSQSSLVFISTPSPTNTALLLDTNYTILNNDLIFLYNLWDTNVDGFTNINAQLSTNALAIAALSMSQITNGEPFTTPVLTATNAAAILIPSNTWNIANFTSAIPNGTFVLANSNGLALEAIWISNTIPIIRQISP